jgi:hypothetical protein
VMVFEVVGPPRVADATSGVAPVGS